MSIIKAENLTFSYPTSCDDIFYKANFQIDTNWKLGLVGSNGKGKTTLLNLLLGKYEYSGKIISSVKFDYFPFKVADKSKITKDIFGDICPYAKEWEIKKELSLMNVNSEVIWRTFEELSNGEQAKVLIAALFLNEGNFLLIDEPTNHLDYHARKTLSEYLNNKKGFILVSHDRCLLDGCVDHILSINRAGIEINNGNFSSWIENFQRQQQFENTQNEKLKRDINHLQQAARRSSEWSNAVEKSKIAVKNSGSKIDKGYVGHKSAKMMRRSKSIEARKQQAINEKSSLLKNAHQIYDLKMYPISYHDNLLVSFSNTAVIYNNIQISRPVSFSIHQGDRVAVVGKNGSGKSSLLKLLTKQPIKYTGTVTIGSGLVISYVSQDTSQISGSLSDFSKENQIDESLFKALLRKMGFEQIQFEKDIKNYSDGQKKKVLLAKSLCQKAHLYVWDEPLNFVDIYSRIQIEQLIKKFSPTMIFIEHDAKFINSVSTKVIEIKK